MSQPFSIAIDARPLSRSASGFSFYTLAVTKALIKAGWEVSLFSNKPLLDEYDVTGSKVEIFGQSTTLAWEQNDIVKHLKERPYNLYLTTSNRGIPLRSVAPTRTILSLLDIIPFLFPGHYLTASKFSFLRKELFPQLSSLIRANAVVTISNKSASDIRRRFGRNAKPLLIPLNLQQSKSATPLNQFCYVGGIDPRKQISVLITAFAKFHTTHTDYKLILMGRGFDRFTPLITKLGLRQYIVLPGYVSDSEKQQTLSQSRALIYPSLYEGYGLVIAEGFAAGVPVLAGKGGSQSEIGKDAVQYIEPRNAASITKAMEEVIDAERSNALIKAGNKRLAELSDPSIASKLVSYFESQASIPQRNMV